MAEKLELKEAENYLSHCFKRRLLAVMGSNITIVMQRNTSILVCSSTITMIEAMEEVKTLKRDFRE